MVPPAIAFEALIRPQTYPEWLVGAREIRAVDADWPQVGSLFHHRVGLVGPLTVADSTKVLAIDAPHRLVLEVRARPFGRGRVEFTLEDVPPPAGGSCTRISIDEVPIGMLASAAPALDPLIIGRNTVSLNALVAYLNTPSTLAALSDTGERSSVDGNGTASGRP